MRFISVGASRDLEHTRQRVQSQIDAFARHGYALLTVVERESGEVIGDCGLLSVPKTGEVEVAYGLHRDRWSRGLATEATRAVLDWARTVLGLGRVVAFVLPDNVASRRVLEKARLTRVGDREYHGDRNEVYVLDCDSGRGS